MTTRDERLRKAAQAAVDEAKANAGRVAYETVNDLRAALEAEPEPHEAHACHPQGCPPEPRKMVNAHLPEMILAEPEPGGEPVWWEITWKDGDKTAEPEEPKPGTGQSIRPLFAAPPDTVPKALADAMAKALDDGEHKVGGFDVSCQKCNALTAYRAQVKP